MDPEKTNICSPVRAIKKTQLYSGFILQRSKAVSLLTRIFPTYLKSTLLRPNLLIKKKKIWFRAVRELKCPCFFHP